MLPNLHHLHHLARQILTLARHGVDKLVSVLALVGVLEAEEVVEALLVEQGAVLAFQAHQGV